MESNGSSRSSAVVSDDAPRGALADVGELRSHVVHLLNQVAEPRALVDDVVELYEHGAGAGRVGESEI